jgi:hypothetical protein
MRTVPELRFGLAPPSTSAFGRVRLDGASGYFSHGDVFLRDMGHCRELETRYKQYIYLHELRSYSAHYILDTIHIVN